MKPKGSLGGDGPALHTHVTMAACEARSDDAVGLWQYHMHERLWFTRCVVKSGDVLSPSVIWFSRTELSTATANEIVTCLLRDATETRSALAIS